MKDGLISVNTFYIEINISALRVAVSFTSRDSFGNTPQRTQRKPGSRRMPGEKKRKNKANRYKDLPFGLKKKKPTPYRSASDKAAA